MELAINLCGERLDNPIIAASGTFGYGQEFAELYDINVLGSFSFKGTTLNPRFGNPTPRIAEAPSGMINSVGLQNPGIDAVLQKEIPNIKKIFNKKVMANVSGFSLEEYVEVCKKLNNIDIVGWLEVNISCPNVHGGGMSFGTDPKSAEKIVTAVKKSVNKPVIVKLTPNVTDITEIARACEAAGADGLSLINTVEAMRISLQTKKPILKNITGGLSGAAIFPIALKCVYKVFNAVKIPIVGMGGITTAEDVLEMMLAGATAVEVGAANLVNPYVMKEIIDALPEAMAKYRINNLSEIIGGAH